MSEWPFTVEIPVQWRDLDALGHVNNAVYLSYLETARVRLWHERMGGRDARDIPFVVARVEIDYRRSIELGQRVTVAIRCDAIGRSSFTISYRITADGLPCAEARSVQVCIDREGNTIPVPEPMRSALESIR
ncbi:MAG TPA: acyl-CoA thioesterase [Acidobacteria bacterium]|nr:acyl-CoA thioesterase [Acidobacteriota bacterium]